MPLRRLITALAVSVGLIALSLAALQQVNARAGGERLPASQSDLISNWAAVETMEVGDGSKFNNVAQEGLSILNKAPLEEDVLTQIALSRHTALTLSNERDRGVVDAETLSLLKAAQEFNPRNRTVANTLYRHALNSGDYDMTVAQLDLLYRITHPQQRDNGELMALFSALISLAPSRDSVLDALQNRPAWGVALLRYLARNRIGPGLAATADYLDVYAQTADPDDIQAIATVLITRLAQDNQFETAYQVWAQYWPQQDQTAGDALNADPNFQRTAPSPFGWTAFAGRHGSADFEPAGGLYAVYHNGPETKLAEQIFLWPDATSRGLQVLVRGSVVDQPRAGRFLIGLDCYQSNEERNDFVRVETIELNDPLRSKGELSAAITDLSPDCIAGRIRLIGASGEFSQTISMTLHSLSILSLSDDAR